ncbi:patatin-like phospholipase family protein [bacterium]|nr:patatin-like phospholipase family protein [bacterium]MBU1958761.1 patatin-like phospholipase family protein [bacterium]
MKITLSLSGGGLRGAAHVGVIKFLEEQGIEVVAVSGSSAGAIVGLFLAAGLKSDDILVFLRSLEKKDLFVWANGNVGLFSMERLEEKLRHFVDVHRYSDLKIPFYTCVTDIDTGEYCYINEGDPIAYTVASSSITPLFVAKKIGKHTYIDGGFSDNLPVKPLKSYNEKSLAIDINPLRGEDLSTFKSLTIRSILIMIRSNSTPAKKLADAYFEVQGVANMYLFDFDKIEMAYQVGYNEMKENWEELSKKLV